jgi:hypothetical protein
VPLSTPADEKVTPLGSAPVTLNVGAGEPVAVAVNEPAVPTVKVVLLALVIAGTVPTVRVAEAVRPVPPVVELTAPVVLLEAPRVELVTLTETTQLPLAGMVAPLRLIVAEPAVAPVTVPEVQVLVRPGVLATVIPAGNVSLTATPVWLVVVLGLVMVRVSVEVEPDTMAVGLNVLPMVGGTGAGLSAIRIAPGNEAETVTEPVPVLPAVAFSAQAAPTEASVGS